MKQVIFVLIVLTGVFGQSYYRDYPFLVQRINRAGTFSNIDQYNTWDHDQNPLGIFEVAKKTLAVNVGFQRIGWKNSDNDDSTVSAVSTQLPLIQVGVPDKMYLSCYYSISPLSLEEKGQTIAMPQNRFGLMVVGQMLEGMIKMGIIGRGFHAQEKWDVNSNKRIFMGANNVGAALGFQPHEYLIFNVQASASGYVDSLYVDNDQGLPEERFAWLELPRINVAFDFGGEELPFATNFSYCYAKNNFVYTGKDRTGDPLFGPYYSRTWNDSALSSYNDGGDADPLVNDSIAWHWQALYSQELANDFRIDPAITFGYMHMKSRHMRPNEDNHPRRYDKENNGWEWETKSFSFGLGTTFWAKEILGIWFEYERSSLQLDITGDSLSDFSSPEKVGYNHVGFGTTFNVHELPKLSFPDNLNLSVYFSMNILSENELTAKYNVKEFSHLYPLYNPETVGDISDLNVELNRYQPWKQFEKEVKSVNTLFGITTSLLENTIEADVFMGIARRKYTKGDGDAMKGFGFGVNFIYNR